MPIYEYRCRSCGNTFEAIVPNEQSSVLCAKCQSQDLEKLLSTFAVSAAGKETPFQNAPGPCGSCGAAREGMCQMMN